MTKAITHWNKGRKASAETKAKIGAAHRGKKISDEQKRKLSAAQKGIPRPSLNKAVARLDAEIAALKLLLSKGE